MKDKDLNKIVVKSRQGDNMSSCIDTGASGIGTPKLHLEKLDQRFDKIEASI